jgi:hypothetical protein
MGKKELSVIAGGIAKCHSHFERQFDSFLQKPNIRIPFYLSIMLLDIYLKE